MRRSARLGDAHSLMQCVGSRLIIRKTARYYSRGAEDTFEEGDNVIIRHAGTLNTKFFINSLRLGRSLDTPYGKIKHDWVIGKKPRDLVVNARIPDRRASAPLRALQPTLAEYVTLSPRIVTPIYPSDANLLVSLLDIHASPRNDAELDNDSPIEILEAGTGHGSLTLHLARAVHAANDRFPWRKRPTYERRPELQKDGELVFGLKDQPSTVQKSRETTLDKDSHVAIKQAQPKMAKDGTGPHDAGSPTQVAPDATVKSKGSTTTEQVRSNAASRDTDDSVNDQTTEVVKNKVMHSTKRQKMYEDAINNQGERRTQVIAPQKPTQSKEDIDHYPLTIVDQDQIVRSTSFSTELEEHERSGDIEHYLAAIVEQDQVGKTSPGVPRSSAEKGQADELSHANAAQVDAEDDRTHNETVSQGIEPARGVVQDIPKDQQSRLSSPAQDQQIKDRITTKLWSIRNHKTIKARLNRVKLGYRLEKLEASLARHNTAHLIPSRLNLTNEVAQPVAERQPIPLTSGFWWSQSPASNAERATPEQKATSVHPSRQDCKKHINTSSSFLPGSARSAKLKTSKPEAIIQGLPRSWYSGLWSGGIVQNSKAFANEAETPSSGKLENKPMSEDTKPGETASPSDARQDVVDYWKEVDDPNNIEVQKWKKQRRGIVHTVDTSSRHSEHAQKVVREFRGGIYANNVDFHVGDVEDFILKQFSERQTKERVFSHIILDLPGVQTYIEIAARALRVDGILLVFAPSITQIARCVDSVRRHRLPLAYEDVLELGPGYSGGKAWDVRSVRPSTTKPTSKTPTHQTEAYYAEGTAKVPEKPPVSSSGFLGSISNFFGRVFARSPSEAEKTLRQIREEEEWVMVCRPAVGIRVVGGGFVGMWRKKGDGWHKGQSYDD